MRSDITTFERDYDLVFLGYEYDSDCDEVFLVNRSVVAGSSDSPNSNGLVWNPGRIDRAYWPSYKFIPNGEEDWTGQFEPGDGCISGYYSTPSPGHALVVTYGRAVWLNVQQRKAQVVSECYPVAGVACAADARTIVFSDATTITAYSRSGFKWSTDRIAWDGIKFGEINGNTLQGLVLDSPEVRGHVPFTIDLETGEVEGDVFCNVYPHLRT